MFSPLRVRVVRTRASSNSFNPSGIRYEYPVDSNDNIVYLHQQDKIRAPDQTHRPPAPPPPPRNPASHRKSCVKRLFSGLFNFFRFRTTNVGYNEELRYPSSVLCCERNSPFESNSKNLESNNSTACASLTNFSHWENEETFQSDDGEYIIYIPRMSRAKLQRKYVDPLRQANYDPVIIHPLCRQCAGCHSCNLEGNRDPDYSLRSHTKDCSDPDESCRRKKTRYPTSCHTSIENLCVEHPESRQQDQVKESENAGGDASERYPPIKKESVQEFIEDSKSKNFLYIPNTVNHGRRSKCKRRQPFLIQEKNISWDAVDERHNRAARNRQVILQGIKERLQTLFAIWMRRTLIGKMKKKLAQDKKSLALNPPNMLESRYHHIQWLGGRSGNVNNSVGRYFDKEEKTVVALKIFSDTPFETMVENLDNKLMAIQEINSLKKMNHKNIVKLLGYFELHDKFHLILESCDHSLREEIEKNPSGLGTSASKKMIRQVLNGLYFCHQLNCLHRDLSPENILVCKNGVVKIADFDRSVFVTDNGIGTTSPTPGCFVYNSPEILAGDKKYGLPSDVWSLGVIFCEMLIGRPPWNGKSAQTQLREIHNSVGPLLPRHASIAKLQTDEKGRRSCTVNNHAQLQQMFTTISNTCQSFIMKCLDVNPLCRFTCGELLQHQFIKGK